MKKILCLLACVSFLCLAGGQCPPHDDDDDDDNIWPIICIDKDKDGYGYGGQCIGPDCNDNDININPGAPEILCDNVDSNCSGMDDETEDIDGDLFDACDTSDPINPDGKPIDCDDDDPDVYPDAPELCDGYDNQCPGDDGYNIIDDSGCLTAGYAYIPPGCFDMGDCFYEGSSDEFPVHNVCITCGVYFDVTEVTNSQYKACVDDNACTAPSSSSSQTRSSYYGNPTYDDYPVVYVTWSQASAYCAWAGKRLPTEAEWEYAARGGLACSRYPWGDNISCADANYNGSNCIGDTSMAGNYAPNNYGIYDLAGNVYEWVQDYFDAIYYSSSPTNDPPGPATGTLRMMRGGAYSQSSNAERVADRSWFDPADSRQWLGFRCAHN